MESTIITATIEFREHDAVQYASDEICPTANGHDE